MAMASARPYANSLNLQFAPDRCQYLITQFFGLYALPDAQPTVSVRHRTEGTRVKQPKNCYFLTKRTVHEYQLGLLSHAINCLNCVNRTINRASIAVLVLGNRCRGPSNDVVEQRCANDVIVMTHSAVMSSSDKITLVMRRIITWLTKSYFAE